jgi:membrane dipeptidase
MRKGLENVGEGRVASRRDMLRVAGAGAAAFVGGRLVAAPILPKAAVGSRFIIDGNLIPPIDDEHPLPAMIATQVQSAGLTALKLTVGGSGNEGRKEAGEELRVFERSIALNPDLFLKVRSAADLDAAAATGRLGIILSFEAAEMLEGDVGNIDRFRAADVLVMGLTYNKQTPFGSGVLVPRSTGLTALGRQAVERMNAVGVTLDLSHSDEPTSRGALAASARPALVSHAGCAAVHAHPRNKSDGLLRALADKGGVVGIYELSYLAPYPRQPNLDDYMAHMTHALDVCGEDHVGIGTDGFVLPNDTSPAGMSNLEREEERRRSTGVAAPEEGLLNFVLGLDGPNRYAVIADALRRRGHPTRVVDKVMGKNLVRVFRETWRPSSS